MEAREIRQKYLDFFKEKGHAVLPSAPLLPENDPTVLFTTAGMHPLVPYLMGEKHPDGTRLTSFQKCIRTGDIDEVGDDTHLTFFEMLGNWSLGDYFKEDAIKYSFEFLTSKKWLGIPMERLSFTVFKGDDDAPADHQAADIWKSLGVPEHRITYLPKSDNWWGPAGQTGPCGPDTEMFYWVGEGQPPKESNPETDEKNWVEIWNDVFMQYNKQTNGSFEPLKQKNVDTGMGLERTTAILQDVNSVYDTELFQPIISKVLNEAGVIHNEPTIGNPIPHSVYPLGPVGNNISREESVISVRIIVDHLRAATMMAGDGVKPSNNDQGYVMRRLIRRAIRHGRLIGIEHAFTHTIAKKIIHTMSDIYPELKHEEEILRTLNDEEEKFGKTIHKGLQELQKLYEKRQKQRERELNENNLIKTRVFTGKDAFYLFETYGFPIEMIIEELKSKGVLKENVEILDLKAEFGEAYKEHQEKSKNVEGGTFEGGLQDHSWETTRLHTATHLLHAALMKVLGDHAKQRGSNITAERLRFDFSHPDKMTDEQIAAVEKYVNDAIASDHPVTMKVLSLEEAKKSGAIGLFEQKYGDQVKVYDMGPWSKETCGGPHVEHLGQLSHFKITKEKSIGAGLRRIKAILTDK